jgi:hypothetical protein
MLRARAMAETRLVLLGNVRETLEAERRLKAAGVPHRLIPTPPSIDPGCGVAVAFDAAVEESVLRVLRESGMVPKGPFDFQPIH